MIANGVSGATSSSGGWPVWAGLLACLVAGLMSAPHHAFAQERSTSPLRQKAAQAAKTSLYADAEEDHASWVATGAPLLIRPSATSIVQTPLAFAAPLPPQRPVEMGRQSLVPAGNKDAPPPALAPGATPPNAAAVAVAPVLAPSIPAQPPAEETEAPVPSDNPSALITAFAPRDFRPVLPTLIPPGKPEQATPEEIEEEEKAAPEPNFVEKQTDHVNISCLKPELMAIVKRAGEHFKGTPIITSGQRDRGRRGSYHRRCMAVDFVIPGTERSVLASWLRRQTDAGGVGTYCHTRSVHLDIGDARNWWQCGRRFRFALRG